MKKFNKNEKCYCLMWKHYIVPCTIIGLIEKDDNKNVYWVLFDDDDKSHLYSVDEENLYKTKKEYLKQEAQHASEAMDVLFEHLSKK